MFQEFLLTQDYLVKGQCCVNAQRYSKHPNILQMSKNIAKSHLLSLNLFLVRDDTDVGVGKIKTNFFLYVANISRPENRPQESEKTVS